jgi:hypothetical protein
LKGFKNISQMPKKDIGNDERTIVFCFIGEVGKRMMKGNLILVLKNRGTGRSVQKLSISSVDRIQFIFKLEFSCISLIP